MAWRIRFSEEAQKNLDKLDRQVAIRILRFLNGRIAPLENPRTVGEALKGSSLGEFWRYRVGDYRIVARIEDDEICLLIIRIGHRREIYR